VEWREKESRRLRLMDVYGASYFFEDDPNAPVIALWARREPEEEISETRIPDVFVRKGDTTWTSLVIDMVKKPLVNREDWQYAHYSYKNPFFHLEISEPLHWQDPTDTGSQGTEE
jgi:hypothetical protein